MGDPSTYVPETLKKFKTALTDYSAHHENTTGPHADNLDVDAIIVGAGFSESPPPRTSPKLSLDH